MLLILDYQEYKDTKHMYVTTFKIHNHVTLVQTIKKWQHCWSLAYTLTYEAHKLQSEFVSNT